ncbi:hypothetical protein GmHk_18G052339 [Glycine max]|nr:hypothetical protein GYH30_050246 [Glycine max]KAH1198843.1 hypothetical protein GmHk_18G052339 [Glycine max]
MAKKQNQPQAAQAAPDLKNNPPSTSSENSSPIWITRPAPMTILVAEVIMKDKEPRVHVEHFFDIESLENAGVIKSHLMLCGIHHFFEDPKANVPELIHEFWRISKVYMNKIIGRYFTRKVLGIIVKLIAETIAQAIGCERHRTKFLNNWEMN